MQCVDKDARGLPAKSKVLDPILSKKKKKAHHPICKKTNPFICSIVPSNLSSVGNNKGPELYFQ